MDSYFNKGFILTGFTGLFFFFVSFRKKLTKPNRLRRNYKAKFSANSPIANQLP